MSSNLYWRHVPVAPEANRLPYGLKKAIAQSVWGHDGSLNSEPVPVDGAFVPYFNGLRDGGVEGAQAVLDLIEQHGAIELLIAG